MAETSKCGYSSESSQWEISNDYLTWQGLEGSQKSLCPYALDKSSLSIGSINYVNDYDLLDLKG